MLKGRERFWKRRRRRDVVGLFIRARWLHRFAEGSERGKVTPTDEATPVSGAQMSNHYKKSKWEAEVVARELAREGFADRDRESERADWAA